MLCYQALGIVDVKAAAKGLERERKHRRVHFWYVVISIRFVDRPEGKVDRHLLDEVDNELKGRCLHQLGVMRA